MSRLKQLIHEIHRRSLWQVLLIYVGGSWVAFEVVQTLTEGLGLPGWFPALALVLLIVLLPVVFATAFVREAEPAATISDPTLMPVDEAHTETGRRRRLLTWRNAGLSFLVALAVWGVVATGWLLLGERATPEEVNARKSIAVLPFENLSPDPDDAYFADGMHEEIISQLGKIRALKVTSRTSVMDYKGHAGDLRTVAEQLGVANILEGSVRRAGNRVRITTQLIDAETDEHLWSETYERDYSDVFAVESDVAHRVTAALRATLTPEERERVERKPTENLEAYDYYLTGREYLRRRGREYDQIGLEMLGKALELDPGFALVYATISVHYTGAYNPAQGRGQEYADSALAAARKAIELKPDLAEAHHALGRYYYSVLVDYDRAMEEFQIAIRLNPSDGSALFWVGVTQRRRGEWEEALANMRRAAELSPREYGIYPEYPATLTWMRRYEEAEPFYDRAIVLAPDRIFSYWFKAWGYLNQTGGIEESLRVWERLLAINPKASRANVQSFDARAGLRIWHDHVRQYARGPIRESVSNSSGYLLATAISYDLDGETELSHAYYDSTRVALEALLERAPDNPRYRSILGVSLAGMGRAEDAIREARRAVEVVPVSEDALSGPLYVATLAEVYAMVGEYDAAIDRLEYLLSITCPISPPLLQADPIWDPLRDHPRFQALLEEYE